MNPRTSRIVATAVFDDRAGQVIVAGQVLDGLAGVEGLALTVTLAGRSLRVATGPHGSFGVRFDGITSAIGRRATLHLAGLHATCDVH